MSILKILQFSQNKETAPHLPGSLLVGKFKYIIKSYTFLIMFFDDKMKKNEIEDIRNKINLDTDKELTVLQKNQTT